MRTTVSLVSAAMMFGAASVHAQQPAAPKAGAVSASAPGKFAAAATVEVTAMVKAVDKGTRTVTLQGPQGRVVDVVAGDEVRNFDQIRVGDSVSVQYVEALTLDLKKSQAAPGATASGAVARAAPGQRPGAAAGREIVVLADVVGVDQSKSTIH